MIRFPPRSASPDGEAKLFAGTNLQDWVGASSTYAMFRNSALEYGARTALTHVETGNADENTWSLSYAQLFTEITRTANLLSHHGAVRDSSVALLLPNRTETQLFLWGAGTVSSALPLNPFLSPKVLAELMRAAKADILVTVGSAVDDGMWQKAMALSAELGENLRCIFQVGGDFVDDSRIVLFVQAKAEMPGDALYGATEPNLDDTAAYFHTGGTTGSPKLIRHSHRNHLAAAFSFAYRYDLSADDVFTNGFPLYHVAGVLPCSLSPFMTGAHVLNLSASGLRNPKILANIWRIVERYKVTSVSGVPTALGALIEVPLADADISSIRKVCSGGALLPNVVAQRFESLIGVPVQEAYGMTETAAIICSELPGRTPVVGSVGFPAPFVQVQIRSILSDGTLAAAPLIGKPGVLVVKGATVTPGYKDEKQNQEAFTADGWLITGDIAVQDADGRIKVTGRSKDVIIRSGHNIDPLMIEEAVMAFPGVSAAAAVSQPDVYAGELPVCYVVPRPDANLDISALQEHLKVTVPERPAVPKHIYLVDALPMTAVGKVFKPDLRCDAAMRLLHSLLADVPHKKIAVVEDGSRTLHVTVHCNRHDDTDSIQRLLGGRLDPFLFRWKLQVEEEIFA
ncbi:hypothetical protein B1219_18240 [Pseudomonas ogarae]|uniref:AMP-binding protein n=1 Tax=Pseudomonas ogarae (strain DSM 112162 / CECT 30235 / F113) TaxID=1114970 RepID=UPI0009A2ACCE|nr:AMP-binding protein [Pseudomonas ogarae]OPG72098.1 hypothetical protein B1219_18240 [Pseudomonas ogarae]